MESRLGEARRSWVQVLAGSRRRRWGYLHDQIWFPISDMEFLEHIRRDPGARTVMSRFDAHQAGCPRPQHMRLYLDRRILRLGSGRTLRFHTFYTGDDDSAPHDHAWTFWTFPLDAYQEVVEIETTGERRVQTVRRLRLHRREATHRHYVLAPDAGKKIRTIVLTGRTRRTWGFWPRFLEFVPFPEWTDYQSGRKK